MTRLCRISTKQIIEKLLDQIDANLTLTFEHILEQLLNESALTASNIISFIDLLLDYYLKLTIDQSKKHLSDAFFKQIQERQSSFLQLISFVIPYDRKQRLASQFPSILQSLRRQIETHDLSYFRYQMEIISHLLSTRQSSDCSNDFAQSISKKLLDCPTADVDPHVWINCMKQMFAIFFHKSPHQSSLEHLPMKFLRSLAEQIQWPVDYFDVQTKCAEAPWRTTFIRMLASINALLTHRVRQSESRTHSPNRRISKEKIQSINSNGDEDGEDDENSSVIPSISRALFDQDDGDEQSSSQEETPSSKQQNSNFSHLEQELLQSNSLFSSVEKWMDTVSRTQIERKTEITCLLL